MIAAMFLRAAMDFQPMFVPFGRDDSAAAVGVGFFEAGGFGDYKTAKGVEHLRQGWLKEVFDFLSDKESGHCANMLTMRRGKATKHERGVAGSSKRAGLWGDWRGRQMQIKAQETRHQKWSP
jgi:hypothetical protein